ncbi:MAG: cytochrome PufQ [Pseudomonadota bacterium]
MTDMTSQGTGTAVPKKRNGVKAEFMVYFAIIFLATLPLATFTWGLAAIRSRSFTEKGPMARAWTQARIITPMIFNA